MMKASPTPGVFTIRFGPRCDESISSLRHRVGLANGYASFPRFMARQHQIDPDLDGTDEEAGQLAYALGLARDCVRECSLAALAGTVFQTLKLKLHPAWLLKSKYSQTAIKSGPTFCAECLRSDKTPYFRLSWRVGLFTECLHHRVELLDKCPHCGSGVWPHHAGRRALFEDSSLSLDFCPVCRGRLSEACPSNVDPSTGVAIRQILDAGHMEVSPQLVVPASEIASTLEAICGLFMRRRSRNKIAQSDSQWSPVAHSMEDSQENFIAALAIPVRRDLVRAAWGLLDQWPDKFLAFAASTGLTQEHFSGTNERHPKWVEAEVRKHLRRQIRGISVAEVRSTVESLRLAGTDRVTKNAVRLLLNSQASAIDKVLSRRFEATSAELDEVLESMAKSARREGKRTVFASCARDHVVFCVAALTRSSLEQAGAMTTARLEEVVARTSSDPSSRDKPLVKFLARRLYDYAQSSARGHIGRAGTLYVARGGRPHRPAQHRMSRAMVGLDARLARQVSVFWRSHGVSA